MICDNDRDWLDNPAWCQEGHQRTGLVTNQDPSSPYDDKEPLNMVSTCDQANCIAKGMKHVAGNTNRRADYYSDADRRAAR